MKYLEDLMIVTEHNHLQKRILTTIILARVDESHYDITGVHR